MDNDKDYPTVIHTDCNPALFIVTVRFIKQ